MIVKLMGSLSRLREIINSENIIGNTPNAINAMRIYKERLEEVTKENVPVETNVLKKKMENLTKANNAQMSKNDTLEL